MLVGVLQVVWPEALLPLLKLSEHWNIVWRVLECLQEHRLYLKPEKCKFEQKQIEYLRVIVSEGQVEMDPVKVSGIAEWPIPQNKKEVQSFIGFINFYRRFIKDFSHHPHALFNLTKKDVGWKWEESEQVVKGYIEMSE